ncbi:hypothetical protein [Sneathiella sp.]|uniref:thermonuclease family protein n=1 Tax=Sneathiella sp. TaxID=1964365 RepID=UPI00262D5BBF|nr:hypothetical protein [Sneathiella sp.]MDF2367061.1 hypothetical protein [Sneathiella sp.]
MRFQAFLTAVICIGSMSAALAGAGIQTHVAERVEADLIVTKNNDRIALYGVRLVEEAQDPTLYRKAQRFLRQSFEPPSFRLDVQAFRESGSAQNRYGDLHGKILLADGTWLQERLIAQGYGVWSGAPDYPPALRQRLVQAETGAAIEKLGIWRHIRIVNANQPARQFWNGQFIVAKGLVREVFRGASATYLNFGEDWRNDFTVAIPSRSRKKFEREDWKIADLKNRSVTVRGAVRFYNGPYLELDFPEQLEINDMASEG